MNELFSIGWEDTNDIIYLLDISSVQRENEIDPRNKIDKTLAHTLKITRSVTL